jgi:hypothetical protein
MGLFCADSHFCRPALFNQVQMGWKKIGGGSFQHEKMIVRYSNQPFDFPRSEAWGLPRSLRSGRKLRVDTERRFSPRPKGGGFGAVEVSKTKLIEL